MKFCLVVNESKPLANSFAKEFALELEKRSFEYFYYDRVGDPIADFIVIFGGDGTILKFIRSAKISCPVLGINCGNMGFLAEAGKTAAEYVNALVKGDY